MYLINDNQLYVEHKASDATDEKYTSRNRTGHDDNDEKYTAHIVTEINNRFCNESIEDLNVSLSINPCTKQLTNETDQSISESTAANALTKLVQSKTSQSIIICGERGSGKVMQYSNLFLFLCFDFCIETIQIYTD